MLTLFRALNAFTNAKAKVLNQVFANGEVSKAYHLAVTEYDGNDWE